MNTLRLQGLTLTDIQYACLVSTLVSTYSWLVHTLHLVPSSCKLCQQVLITSTLDKKYRFDVLFLALSK